MNQFVHLHVHSGYSLSDGIARISDLVNAVRKRSMPAIALTDLCNMYAAVKFYRRCVDEGVKPLIGAEVWIRQAGEPNRPVRLLLLCRDNSGYRRLCQLLSNAYLRGFIGGKPCIDPSWLEDHAEGLIALSAGQQGELGLAVAAGNDNQARQVLDNYRRLFADRYYVEVSRIGAPGEEYYVEAALDLAAQCQAPLVATNPVQFIETTDYDSHEVRVCINDSRVLADPRRQREFTQQQYLRSAEEMARLFADVPEALDNSVEIARRCNVTLGFDHAYLPQYPVDADCDVETLLREQSTRGLQSRRRSADTTPETDGRYAARLERELDVIIDMGFAGYFLIVADFIHWAKQHSIPVGPGRGSGAGSLVAYGLGITELDPIEHGLLFERFLNPERVSLPDFDIDFCMEGRDRVIEYVMEKYGRDKVAQIITHGTMAARAVVRDVGRVMSLGYGYVDTIAKLIPFEVGMTLDKALNDEPLLRERYDTDDEVRELIDTGKLLEGLPRNVGKHAGGVVIAPAPLTEFTALYCERDTQQAVTQMDKDDLEAVGLVKFDFLGLKTLTIIDKTVKLVNQQAEQERRNPISLDRLTTDDTETYELIKTGRTTGVFQLESRGIRELIQRLGPDRFEDLVALVALYRPGPLQSGMVEDFINRKHGRDHIRYPHPALESILQPTYGVILYQEQVMEIAQVLAGYSLGSADLLRRAMGKKKPEEMAVQRQIFLDGARHKDVDLVTATHIFDLMEKFAGYGFNKSHSAAYAMITYQTAWLKTHHRAAFMAACLSADMEHTDKIVGLIAECRDLDIQILPPDINRCQYEFMPVGENEILYGLGAIKGIGSAAIDNILNAREQHESFEDLVGFCRHVDSKRVNRRVAESLIKAGAMDALGSDRATLSANLQTAINVAEQEAAHIAQSDLFGVQTTTKAAELRPVTPWSDEERLKAEKETLGLYLTGHPMDRFRRELAQLGAGALAQLNINVARQIVVVGLVVAFRTLNTRRGEKIAFLTLDDHTGRIDVSVFAELYNTSREIL
ncbi:MAG: DNA polymerase III subunit alpha, partial [Gammaproteobacteria bacterium]|nr:DNA polymerase III subunit alpha [Gammaproteobacteria bacterium]